jgi:hypothetical protein
VTGPPIRLTHADLMLDAKKLAGQFLDARHYDRVVRDDAVVLRPDGRLLLLYAGDVLPPSLCEAVFEASKHLHPTSDNRGTAAGGHRRIAPSDVFGFLDRYPTNPYCRMTGFTIDHDAEYETALPLFVAISRKYQELAPHHWEVQHRFADTVSPDFVIPGTTFTSVTINRDFRTAAHTDSGNYRPGLEAIAVLAGGRYEGCELVFPRYRTAVDMRMGGLCLADMHELHGNAPLVGRGLRLSLVCYARAGMCRCGSAEEEWRRAARLRSASQSPRILPVLGK